MEPIKLSKITKAELDKLKIQSVDVVSYTIQLLNDRYPKVELIGGHCKLPHGRVVQRMEPYLFNEWCRAEEQFNLEKKLWIMVEGEFYDVEEIIIKFKSAGLSLENDF
jgi:hypothetical protein